MPVVQVTLIEGYSEDARRQLCERLTDATMAVIEAPADAVTVFINEVAPAGYMRGRTGKTPGRAHRPAADVALEFLDLRDGATWMQRAPCAPKTSKWSSPVPRGSRPSRT